MGIAQGSIDARGRPVVRISLASGSEDFLALLDTGFNGSLLCNSVVAARIGVEPSGLRETVQLAGDRTQEVDRGWLRIVWLGREQRARILITPTELIRRADQDGDPVALIGSSLLTPHLVLLDYGSSTLQIEEQ